MVEYEERRHVIAWCRKAAGWRRFLPAVSLASPVPEAHNSCLAGGRGAGRRCRPDGLPGGAMQADGATPFPALVDELREALAPGLILLDQLAQGGMGSVFLARDPALKRTVVVKVLLPELAHDPAARARFAREAEAAAAVSHPNVVGVFQVGELPRSRTAYFVMQYVDGVTLAEAHPAGTPAPVARAGRILGEIASALAAAHARGLVHRDIKPANVMLERGTDRVLVLDFGISAAVSPERRASAGTRLTQAGTSLGTPAYMSPEQAAAEEVTDRSDVYSLGVVAFELLAGRLPFTDVTPMALAAAHIKDAPPSLASLRPDLDPSLDRLVARMLAKAPGERPAAAEVARALLPAAHTPVEWPPPGLERLRGRVATALRWQAGMLALTAAATELAELQPALGPSGGELFAPLAAMLAALGVVAWMIAWGFALEGVRWARRSGYPLGIAVDVALDTHPDTALLVGGLGRYAALGAERGRRLLRRRRWGAAVTAGGAVVTIVALLGWTAGVPWLPDVVYRAGGVALVLLLFAPALLGGAGRRALAWEERALRGRSGVAEERLLKGTPPVAPPLVAGWLASAGVRAPAPRSRAALWLRFELVELSAALLGLLMILIPVPVGLAAFLSPPARPRLAVRQGWQRQVDFASAPANNAWLALDSLLRAYAPRAAASDLAAARSALASDPRARSDPGAVWEGFARLPAALPATLRERLDAATGDLRPLRDLAASAPLPPAWFQRPGPLDVHGGDAEARALNVLSRRAVQHAAAAVLALAAGDRAAARRLAGEIVAVGRLLVLDPMPRAHAAGLGVVDIGARTLRGVGLATGDRSLLVEAERLQEAVARRREQAELFRPGVAASYFSGDRDATLVELAARRALAPSDRWRLVEATAEAACWRPEEIRRGPSAGRRALLAAAGAAAADIPRTEAWVAGWQGFLDDAEAGRVRFAEGAGLATWRGPRPIRRMMLCAGVRPD